MKKIRHSDHPLTKQLYDGFEFKLYFEFEDLTILLKFRTYETCHGEDSTGFNATCHEMRVNGGHLLMNTSTGDHILSELKEEIEEEIKHIGINSFDFEDGY